MNIIRINRKRYKYESFWRPIKNKMVYDSRGNPLPFPKERKKWQNQKVFINKLKDTEDHLRRSNKFIKYDIKDFKDCLICGKKNITTGLYQINNIRWESGLLHYIEVHNIKPSAEFIDYIFRYQINPSPIYTKKLTKMESRIVTKSNKRYLRLDRNQILIMDALMRHGGYKQYIDPNNNKIFRYSEHAGLLDFDDNGLEKIIISGNTSRVDPQDNVIFMPKNMDDAIDYEYIFHTHPPTPKIGGRVEDGILYELPSISDLFHFIDHYNDGLTQGSIIMAPEGMYIIRKNKIDDKMIKFNENNFYRDIYRTYGNIQNSAINKYGTDFSLYEFFSKIAQDTSYIKKINKVLNKYDLQVDYYPRVRDEKNRWIIDTIYLPVYVTEFV